MSFENYVANANVAFAGGEYLTSLNYAKEAIKIEGKRPEGYYAAGKAAMSLNRLEEAVFSFKKVVEINKNDGNGYFFLGYAQAMNEDYMNSIRNLTRAIENNCDDNLKSQIYVMMSMINTENGDYHNALKNLEQAEMVSGVDYDILQQKAACYAELHDYTQTIFCLNQMKLIKPNDYRAYSLAFNIFMELEIYDEALAELKRAEEYSELTMQYYNDCISYTLLHNSDKDTQESIRQKWVETLKAIDEGLRKGKPTAEQVFELYLRAAQIYISLEMPEKAIKVLDQAIDPINSFNTGFEVLSDNGSDTYNDIDKVPPELSPEDEEAVMQERWDNGEFDDLRESIDEALFDSISDDTDEIVEEVHKYLSPMDMISNAEESIAEYKLSGEFEMEPLQSDMRNSMYIAAYELLKDYDLMLQKARELQSSSILANQYSGIYYELKVGKYTKKDNWEKKYKERINFWTKRMLQDPTDYLSAGYRVRSYMDIGDFENAEQLCDCLPANVKEPLMDELRKLKSERGE